MTPELQAHQPDNLKLVLSSGLLGVAPEAEFDALAALASLVCSTPIALVGLLKHGHLLLNSNASFPGLSQIPRASSLFAATVLGKDILEIPDAANDPRFNGHPFVTGAPFVRFYAGAPILLGDDTCIGSVCILDCVPRVLTEEQRQVLRLLAVAAGRALQIHLPSQTPTGYEHGQGPDLQRLLHTAHGGELLQLRGARDLSECNKSRELLARSTDFLARTGALVGVGGWELDVDSKAVTWSDEVCHVHGLEPGYRPTLEDALAFYTAESRKTLERMVHDVVVTRTAPGFDLELQITRRDGAMRWVRTVGALNLDGNRIRLAGAFQDITERRELVAQLREQHDLLHVTLQSITDGVITTDSHGQVSWLNPVAEKLTGWTQAAAVGQKLSDIFHIIDSESREPILVRFWLYETRTVSMENATILISRGGKEHGIEHSTSPLLDDENGRLGTVLVFRDVTEQRRLSREMRFRATHDALTRLVNRTEFEERLLHTLNRAQEDGSQHALMYIDLDQFKLVNDACGHAVGDQLLKQVADLISETVRGRDTVARLGGDEFAVILEHCRSEHAQGLAQRVCDQMEEFRFNHQDRRYRIGASIGLVPLDARWTSIAALQQAAETSCYAAKEAGRNRVHLWFDTDAAMHARHGEMQWAGRIEQALDENRFVIYAQCIYPIGAATEKFHAEILIRLKEADGTIVPPGAFLPAAERFGLSSRLDRWVLRQTVSLMSSRPMHPNIDVICVNLSGQSIGDRAFHRQAVQLLTEAGPDICKRICLEITETAAVTNITDAKIFIDQVHALGVRVALDDFGAGASSFGYLKLLPIDYLKIDGQFVKDIIENPLDSAAVRCFIDVAGILGVKTVAEYVDRPDVLNRLREMGADYAQGFLLHKPTPIEHVLFERAEPVAAAVASA